MNETALIELIELIQTHLGEELTAEQISEIRAKLADRPHLPEALLQELTQNLASKIDLDPARISEIEEFVRSISRVVRVAPLATPVCRDRDDDHILALAIASASGMIITGDKDLLILQRYESVEILSPRSFWERERLV